MTRALKKTVKTAANTTKALKTSAAVTAGSNVKWTAADEAKYFAFGRNEGQGKVNALFAFQDDVASGKFPADVTTSQKAAAAYAKGKSGDPKAKHNPGMASAFNKAAQPQVLAIVKKYRETVQAALDTGKYGKAKTSKDAFDSYYAVAKKICDEPIGTKLVLDEAFVAGAVKKTGGNRAKGAVKTKADKARNAIKSAYKALAPKALDKKQQAIVAAFFALVGIQPEIVA